MKLTLEMSIKDQDMRDSKPQKRNTTKEVETWAPSSSSSFIHSILSMVTFIMMSIECNAMFNIKWA